MSSVGIRRAIERYLLEQVVDAALRARYVVGVDYGDGETYRGEDRGKILEEAWAGDEARLYLYRRNDADDETEGWVYLVYGNDGFDTISDYTVNLESLLEAVNLTAEKIEEGQFKIYVADVPAIKGASDA